MHKGIRDSRYIKLIKIQESYPEHDSDNESLKSYLALYLMPN